MTTKPTDGQDPVGRYEAELWKTRWGRFKLWCGCNLSWVQQLSSGLGS